MPTEFYNNDVKISIYKHKEVSTDKKIDKTEFIKMK